MPEHELPWPPERPPTKKAVKKAWNALHKETVAYLKRHLPNERHEARALVKTVHPRELNLRIVTEEEHAKDTVDEMENDAEHRPLFYSAADDEPTYDSGDEDQGDLATTENDLFSSDTRFCVALSVGMGETTVVEAPFPITDYEFRRITVHPDTARYLITRLCYDHRKAVADALVFRLVADHGEELADEEWDDGGVAPEWRNRASDPAMDVLLICTHLQELYANLVGDPDDHGTASAQ